MERREYLKNSALMFGFVVSTTAMSNFLTSCNSKKEKTSSLFFTNDELELVSHIVETILPKTSTPGALDVGVPSFMDNFIEHCFDENGKKEIRQGMVDFNTQCKKEYAKTFGELSADQKHEYLMKHQQLAPKSGMSLWGINLEPNAPKPTFYKQIKGITLFGYFTSEIIGKEHLDYQPVPGEYLACIPVGNSKISFE